MKFLIKQIFSYIYKKGIGTINLLTPSTWIQMVKQKIQSLKDKRKRLTFFKDLTLSLCLFFNPFGFDAVQYFLINLTGNIWRANIFLYCIAGIFFSLYIYFSRKLKKS
jgi:hypothetical protein